MSRAAPAWTYLEDLVARVPTNHAIWRASEAAAITSWPLRRPLLDVGCGDGSFGKMLFREPPDVGVDLRHDQLVRARARRTYRIAVLGSASNLPLPDATFETVVSNCVFEHIVDVDAACREVARVLRPGGSFIFTVPTHTFTRYLLVPQLLSRVGLAGVGRRYVDTMNAHFRHYHIDHPDCWSQRCEAVGMRIVDRKLLMPPSAIALWDALMPVAVMQTGMRRLGRRRQRLERWVLRRLSGSIKPMLAPQPEHGGNIAFLAVRQ